MASRPVTGTEGLVPPACLKAVCVWWGLGTGRRAGSVGEGGGQIGHGAEVHSNHMHEIITV